MAVFADDGLGFEKIAEMLDHGGVHGNAAREDQRRADARVGHQRVDDVFGEPLAQAVADLSDGIAFLLGVDQIRFGKYRTARGDFRRVALVAEGDRREGFDAFQIEAFGLLVEKTARAGGARRV